MKGEIERTIRKILAREIEKKMIDKELDGLIVNKEVVLEILTELTD